MLTLNGSRNKMKIILNIHRPGIHKHNLRSLNQNIVVPMKAANWSLQKKAVRGGGGGGSYCLEQPPRRSLSYNDQFNTINYLI